MDDAGAADQVADFTLELLRTGLMLSGLAADVVEGLPTDAYPGENPGAVVLEMVTGTIRTALATADQAEVARATELIAEARDRVTEHLRAALERSRQIHGEAGDRPRRTHG